ANPDEHHVSAVKMIFRYLKGTINLGLWYPKDFGFDLTAYSEADHAGCHLDQKTESEYVAVSSCCTQVLWMRTQLTDYGFFYGKVPIYCDSKSAIAIRTGIDLPQSLPSHLGKLGLCSRLKFCSSLLKIQVAQKKVKIDFENADSSSRVELIPSKIKYANKVVLNFHKEFLVFSSFTRKENDGLLQDQAYENYLIYKEMTKKLHDSKIKNRIFNVGDQVLLFISLLKIFSGKLKTHWSSPFTITQVFPYGTVELSQPNGPNFKVNGHRVKHYFGGDIPSKVVLDLHTFPMDK
nr:reverse transcriptase domain-containing protein [Tanacetum cinerariifolium]